MAHDATMAGAVEAAWREKPLVAVDRSRKKRYIANSAPYGQSAGAGGTRPVRVCGGLRLAAGRCEVVTGEGAQ